MWRGITCFVLFFIWKNKAVPTLAGLKGLVRFVFFQNKKKQKLILLHVAPFGAPHPRVISRGGLCGNSF